MFDREVRRSFYGYSEFGDKIDILSPHISLLGEAYWFLLGLGFEENSVMVRELSYSKYEAVNLVHLRDSSLVDKELGNYILNLDKIDENEIPEDVPRDIHGNLRDFAKIRLAFDKKFPKK